MYCQECGTFRPLCHLCKTVPPTTVEHHVLGHRHVCAACVGRELASDAHAALMVDEVVNSYCAVCGTAQYETPSGLTCAQGHGGAPSFEYGDAVQIRAWCDGSILGGNPGGTGYAGWLAERDAAAGMSLELTEGSKDLGRYEWMSNNVAEYMAAVLCLQDIHRAITAPDFPLQPLMSGAHVTLHSDSQLVIRQLTGEYSCDNRVLALYRDKVLELATRFASVEYVWIPREDNKRADKLSRALHPPKGKVG